jgi:DNA-binding response OmpR family regulator
MPRLVPRPSGLSPVSGRNGVHSKITQRWPNLLVMMVTAYGDDQRRRRAGEYGAAEFITKPVDFDLLKAQLQQLPIP